MDALRKGAAVPFITRASALGRTCRLRHTKDSVHLSLQAIDFSPDLLRSRPIHGLLTFDLIASHGLCQHTSHKTHVPLLKYSKRKRQI